MECFLQVPANYWEAPASGGRSCNAHAWPSAEAVLIPEPFWPIGSGRLGDNVLPSEKP